MFSRGFFNSDANWAAKQRDPAAPNVKLADYGFGKQAIRVFQLRKNSPRHEIVEFLVTSHMRLRSHKEYYQADNGDVVGSDVQQSNIYVQAQKHGLTTPEEFALMISKHFLDNYEQAEASNIMVEQESWSRLGEHETTGYYKDKTHNHVFSRVANGRRYCEVVRTREDPKPLLISGLSGLRMIKTAQAPFTGYVKGSLYTEGDQNDRILCVEVNAKWQYSKTEGVDFSTSWHRVRDVIIQSFAGDVVKGVITTSVQYVSYKAGQAILKAFPEICSASVHLLNISHIPFDFSRFPSLDSKADVIISDPHEDPHSVGYAQVDRHTLNQTIDLY